MRGLFNLDYKNKKTNLNIKQNEPQAVDELE